MRRCVGIRVCSGVERSLRGFASDVPVMWAERKGRLGQTVDGTCSCGMGQGSCALRRRCLVQANPGWVAARMGLVQEEERW